MELGFETIGNATLICHDRSPVLVTDPWVLGNPYFGSWKLAYEIPEEQVEAIKKCEYVWLSHGHPDHLDMKTLQTLKDKKILIPDHVGGRIGSDMGRLGFSVTVLKDRVWTELSPRIHVLCVADYNQDGILLVDIDGTLILDLNDASPRGWGPFVKKMVRKYNDTFLLQIFGYGDADMINYLDEDGVMVEPRAALKLPVGTAITRFAESFGVKYIVPFSSLHKYQRADSVWANQYLTPLEAYHDGFDSNRCELLPGFIRYDCLAKTFDEINPPKSSDDLVDPKEFGDDWAEPLQPDDVQKVQGYFQAVTHLSNVIDFVNVRVAGEDHVIELANRRFDKGIVFEVPRRSLMRAMRWQVFDDLLIGNFMRTTLIGKWPQSKLYPDFTPYVAKYADNGLAKSEDELRQYFREYRRRAPLDYLRHDAQYRLASAVRTRVDSRSSLYQLAHKAWWFVGRRIGV